MKRKGGDGWYPPLQSPTPQTAEDPLLGMTCAASHLGTGFARK